MFNRMFGKLVLFVLAVVGFGCASAPTSHPHFYPDTHETEYVPIDDRTKYRCVKDIDVFGHIVHLDCTVEEIK